MSSENMIIYCVNCGNPINEDAKFCTKCGAKTKSKKKKRARRKSKLKAFIAVVVLAAVAVCAFYVYSLIMSRPDRRIAKAFDNTMNAGSFCYEKEYDDDVMLSLRGDKEYIEITDTSLEDFTCYIKQTYKGEPKRETAYSHIDNIVYSRYQEDEYFIEDLHDSYAAMQNFYMEWSPESDFLSQSEEEFLYDSYRDYNPLIAVQDSGLLELLKDYHSNPNDFDFIEFKYIERKNQYVYEMNRYEFYKTLIYDYDFDKNANDIEYLDKEETIKIIIGLTDNNKYISSIGYEYISDNYTTYEKTCTLEKIGKIDFENSKTAKFIDRCKKYGKKLSEEEIREMYEMFDYD